MSPKLISKPDIRKATLAKRDSMAESDRIEASLKFLDFVDRLDVKTGEIISGFLPIRSEVDLRPFMASLSAKGARLCVPVIIDKETIVFRHLVKGAELITSGFGTVGPAEDAEVLDPDILLMPLAAFDDYGNRIGYGGGYYDRAIERLHAKGLKPRLIGAAFECQRVVAIPAEPHDVPLDAILTENGLQNLKSSD